MGCDQLRDLVLSGEAIEGWGWSWSTEGTESAEATFESVHLWPDDGAEGME